jgi:hypothetical protein
MDCESPISTMSPAPSGDTLGSAHGSQGPFFGMMHRPLLPRFGGGFFARLVNGFRARSLVSGCLFGAGGDVEPSRAHPQRRPLSSRSPWSPCDRAGAERGTTDRPRLLSLGVVPAMEVIMFEGVLIVALVIVCALVLYRILRPPPLEDQR